MLDTGLCQGPLHVALKSADKASGIFTTNQDCQFTSDAWWEGSLGGACRYSTMYAVIVGHKSDH
jgi:hypothetical protein